MKINQEIQAIIGLIQSHLGVKSELDITLFENINWQRFEKALDYHSIRPLAFEEFQKAKIKLPEHLQTKLSNFSKSQAIFFLRNTLENERLKKLFIDNNIEILPFKGVAYQKDFYTKGLRESSDIDVLISPKQLKDSIQLLLNDGYLFSSNIESENIVEITNSLLKAKEQYEFAFNKNNHHIDLHWGLHYAFLPYEIPEDFLSSLKDNREQIFWTMLNHHGGKEFWLKLKNLLDLALFVDKYIDILDWQSFHLKSKEFNMETVFLNGFYLLKKIINSKIPQYIEKQLTNHQCLTLEQTLAFWAKSELWSKPIPRLNYELILLKSQDSGFSKWVYFKDFYKSYTLPNLIEPKRLITFPERFHFLNFLSKVFSYIIKKTLGIK